MTVEPEFFVDVVKLARRYGFMVISDFAYADVAFDGYQPPSFLAAPGAKDVGVEFTTMSKGYNMAGWRVGFCAGNAEMVRALGTIKAYYDYGMFQPIQIAAIMALRHTDAAVEAQSVLYQRRRDVLCDGLAPHRLGHHSAAGRHVRLGQNSRALGQPDGHHGLRHEAAGRGRRGRQPGQRLRPGRRRLFAAGPGRKRKPPAPGRAADRPLPGQRTAQPAPSPATRTRPASRPGGSSFQRPLVRSCSAFRGYDARPACFPRADAHSATWPHSLGKLELP